MDGIIVAPWVEQLTKPARSMVVSGVVYDYKFRKNYIDMDTYIFFKPEASEDWLKASIKDFDLIDGRIDISSFEIIATQAINAWLKINKNKLENHSQSIKLIEETEK